MPSTPSDDIEEDIPGETPAPPLPSSPSLLQKWAINANQRILPELRQQRGIAIPLVAMNLTWFLKTAITTAYLGRLGELQLAGGALGFTFANITGFSVLTGLSGAMEPICGQAFGARNYKLMHKTLLMATLELLVAAVPISLLWLALDKILLLFGQQEDIIRLAKKYVIYLLPNLLVTSFLCPLKAYLSSQGIILPTLFSSTVALAFHIPLNIFLSEAMGLKGVAMANWLTDLSAVIILALYVLISEGRNGESSKLWSSEGGGWLEQTTSDWSRLLKLSAPCCFTTCIEWWCFEILVLLAGRLPNAKQAVVVLAVVFNFDYLLFSIMLSLATCASTRVSNELGAGQARAAHRSALVSLGLAVVAGFLGGSIMVTARGKWGTLYSHDKAVIGHVRKMLLLMSIVEVVNFPLAVCGGIVRGTARPWLGMYASTGGFYLVALPLAVHLAFKIGLGVEGLLLGFLVGSATSLILLVFFVGLIDWVQEAGKAQKLACVKIEDEEGQDSTVVIEGSR